MEQRSPGRGERGPGGKKPPRGSPITYSVARAKRLVHVFVDAYCVLVLSLLVYRFVSVMNPSALGFVFHVHAPRWMSVVASAAALKYENHSLNSHKSSF